MKDAERDLQLEIDSHIAEAAEEYVQRGFSPEDALAAARRDFGGLVQVREAHREARRPWLVVELERCLQDVRQSVRIVPRQPLFTVGVVLMLALGIGLVTALLSMLNGQFYRPWQVPDPASMALIRARPAAGEPYGAISIDEYRYLRDHAKTVRHLAASYQFSPRVVDKAAGELRVVTQFVSANYFNAIGIGVQTGRTFAGDEDDSRAPKAVAIVSERLWRNRFASDRAILGRTIQVDDKPFLIIGVAARGFAGVGQWGRPIDLWLPLAALGLKDRPVNLKEFVSTPGNGELLPARLAPGVTRLAAAAELSVLSAQFRSRASATPSTGIVALDTRPLSMAGVESIPATHRRTYVLSLAAAGIVLLLACANVGNLLLAQGLSRAREIAVRLSLGASRSRVVRQLLTEAMLLSCTAGAIGLAFAFAAPRIMRHFGFWVGGLYGFRPNDDPSSVNPAYFEPDAVVFMLAMALCGMTTVLAALAPAIRVTGLNLATVSAERHGRTQAGARLRFVLLGAQIALTTLLLVSAGLLTRALADPSSLNPGFAMEDLQAVSVELPYGGNMPRRQAFALAVGEAFERSDIGPVALSSMPPFEDDNYVMMARRPEDAPDAFQEILLRLVSRHYFRVLGVPIVRGRVPASDGETWELVVNEAAARKLWPRSDPIGKTILSAMGQTEFDTWRVVGVAKDVPVRSMTGAEPVVYHSPRWGASTLLLRADSAGFLDRVRGVVATVEPRATMSARSYASYMGDSFVVAAVSGQVAWVAGGLGLVLAAIGAFGVFAFAVQSRRREIGIRLALGARSRHVIGTVMSTAGSALLCGFVAGVAAVIAATPILRELLYGLSVLDPIAYVEVLAILLTAVALATWLPTRRALRIDPASTLRAE
jgi:predicted permease